MTARTARQQGRLDSKEGRGEGVEFPATWSQNATNIVAQKYLRGQLGSPTREHSVKQMIGRVAGTFADWGRERARLVAIRAEPLNGRAPRSSPVLLGLVDLNLVSAHERCARLAQRETRCPSVLAGRAPTAAVQSPRRKNPPERA